MESWRVSIWACPHVAARHLELVPVWLAPQMQGVQTATSGNRAVDLESPCHCPSGHSPVLGSYWSCSSCVLRAVGEEAPFPYPKNGDVACSVPRALRHLELISLEALRTECL